MHKRSMWTILIYPTVIYVRIKCIDCRNAVSRTLLYRAILENIVLLVRDALINDVTLVTGQAKIYRSIAFCFSLGAYLTICHTIRCVATSLSSSASSAEITITGYKDSITLLLCNKKKNPIRILYNFYIFQFI